MIVLLRTSIRAKALLTAAFILAALFCPPVRGAQKALRADPSLATGIGERLFPADEAKLIAPLIARDAPFYDAVITREAIDGVMNFTRNFGLIKEVVPYETVVATEFSALWKE